MSPILSYRPYQALIEPYATNNPTPQPPVAGSQTPVDTVRLSPAALAALGGKDTDGDSDGR